MKTEYSKKKFFIIWIGQFLSVIGSGITGFALSVSVYKATGLATHYSFITLATVAPSILIRPFAGALADRYSRRYLMIIGYFFAGIGVAAIAVIMILNNGEINILQICICMIISSLGTGLSIPAYTSSITLLIPKEFYAVASGMLQITGSAQYLISPLLAGILVTAVDITQIVLIDAFTFGVVIIIMIWLKMPLKVAGTEEERKENILIQIRKVLEYLKESKENFSLIITGMLTNFFMGFLIVLIGPMILSFTTAAMLGMGQSISAMGMVVGSVLVMILRVPKKIYTAISKYVFIMGIGYMLIGLTENLVLIVIACIIFFYSVPYINTYIDVVFRKTVDKNMQGRMYAIQGCLVQVGFIVSYSIAGLLADNVFEPMFEETGVLADSVGRVIGIGTGRGIGFIFVLCGFAIIVIGSILRYRMSKVEKDKVVITTKGECKV